MRFFLVILASWIFMFGCSNKVLVKSSTDGGSEIKAELHGNNAYTDATAGDERLANAFATREGAKTKREVAQALIRAIDAFSIRGDASGVAKIMDSGAFLMLTLQTRNAVTNGYSAYNNHTGLRYESPYVKQKKWEADMRYARKRLQAELRGY